MKKDEDKIEAGSVTADKIIDKQAQAAAFVAQVASEEIRRSLDAVVQALINRNVELAVRLRAAESRLKDAE